MSQTFTLRPSRHLATVLTALHALAMFSVWVVPLPLWSRAVLLFVLLLSWGYFLCRDVYQLLPDSWVALRQEGQQMVVLTHSGEAVLGAIHPSSLASPLLIVLRILPQDRHWPRNVVLFSDSLEQETLRHLRVSLKWC